MKHSVLQQKQQQQQQRSNSFRGLEDGGASAAKSPASLFWLVVHAICCLISLVLGFRFSRIILFLLFSSSSSTTTTTDHYTVATPLIKSISNTLSEASETLAIQSPSPPATHLDASLQLNRSSSSRVVVGRHGILIRPWPHPNPIEVMKAHRIIDRVQTEQRDQYGIKNEKKTVIVVTPTYVRTFQTLHLTGLMHSLMLVPYDLVWIVVEAGGVSNETAAILEKSKLKTIHIGFDDRMPITWDERHLMEARMRLRALRVVREERLDGVVMFCDDSNMHSMELFDEIHSLKWIGAVSVGILVHSWNSEDLSALPKKQEEEENLLMPIQGPACNSSGQLVGWHTFNSLPYTEKGATNVGDKAVVLPRKLEWAGFVLNSRLVWKDAEDKPEWVRDLDTIAENGDVLESPLSLLKDASVVEPLGKCGRKVMLWWLRVEARADSKFPPGWVIDPPLEITVPAKRTPWPDAPPELPSDEKVGSIQEHTEKRPSRTGRASKPKHTSRKRKHESRLVDAADSRRHGQDK